MVHLIYYEGNFNYMYDKVGATQTCEQVQPIDRKNNDKENTQENLELKSWGRNK
jgi:hypothetical protein